MIWQNFQKNKKQKQQQNERVNEKIRISTINNNLQFTEEFICNIGTKSWNRNDIKSYYIQTGIVLEPE